jgi:hypothetical protein
MDDFLSANDVSEKRDPAVRNNKPFKKMIVSPFLKTAVVIRRKDESRVRMLMAWLSGSLGGRTAVETKFQGSFFHVNCLSVVYKIRLL